MTGASFNRQLKTFGFNVQVPERTLQEAGKSLENLVKSPTAPLADFLEKNQNVFTGDVLKEIKSINVQCFNIGSFMRKADEQINGKSKFEMDM